MKVVGYIRVSTEEQAQDGVSLDAQRAKVEGYARLYDLTLVDVVADAGQSAKTLDRPGLARALELLNAGRAAGLVVAKLDRLTRSVADLATLLDAYFGERPGKQLFSVADAIDTRTAAGRLVLNVLMSVAQWERETIVERTRDAMRHKKGRAERVGQLPYGRDLAADGRTLVPNDREQQVLAEIRVRRDRGHSLRRIAAELTRLGVPTKTGNARWSHSSIADILKGAHHAQGQDQDRPERETPGRGPARAE
jgi:DNA invertase Pin-like site-specific DNA recombinase